MVTVKPPDIKVEGKSRVFCSQEVVVGNIKPLDLRGLEKVKGLMDFGLFLGILVGSYYVYWAFYFQEYAPFLNV